MQVAVGFTNQDLLFAVVVNVKRLQGQDLVVERALPVNSAVVLQHGKLVVAGECQRFWPFVAFQISLSFTNDFTNNVLWFFTGMIFAVIRLDRRGRAGDGQPHTGAAGP